MPNKVATVNDKPKKASDNNPHYVLASHTHHTPPYVLASHTHHTPPYVLDSLAHPRRGYGGT